MREALPQVINTPELRFHCDDGAQVRGDRGGGRRGCKAAGAKVSDIDGVRVQTEDGWWLLRASNTQAVLVARAEATAPPGWSG